MVSMNIGIGWKIILNTTELEFHQLQHKLKELISDEVLHCLSKGKLELLKDNVEIQSEVVDIYVRIHDNSLDFACIHKGRTEE